MSNDPNDWWQAMKHIPPEVAGPLVAFVMAFIRYMYDEDEPIWFRGLLEGAICSGLAVGASAAIKALELNFNWILAASTFIGFTGTMYLRVFFVRFMNRRIDK